MAQDNIANVKDASVFQDLMSSINNFIRAGQQTQSDAHRLIANSMDRLHQIERVLQQRLDDAQRKVQNAERELSICEATPCYDSQGNRIAPNCASQRSARREANIQYEAAQENMSRMHEILKHADQLIAYYENEEKRFQHLIDEKLPANHRALSATSRYVDAYKNTHIIK